jgi:hypothetical protein
MARGGHGLLKVYPDPSTSCRRATPETALQPYLGWLARRAVGLRPSSTPLDTPRCTHKLPSDLLRGNDCNASQWLPRDSRKEERRFPPFQKTIKTWHLRNLLKVFFYNSIRMGRALLLETGLVVVMGGG